MCLEVGPLQKTDLPEALELYNRATASVAHCFPASGEELEAWLGEASPRLDRDLAVGVKEGQRLVAWARVGRGGPDACTEPWSTVEPGDGVIRFAVGESAIGLEAAVRQCLAELDCWGVQRVWACEDDLGPPFYNGGFGQLSHAMPLTIHALARAGFRVYWAELHMTCPSISRERPPDAEIEFSVDRRKLPSGEWSLDAVDSSGNAAGQCVWASMAHKSRHPDARRYGYVWWLGVEERFRGLGVGRRLLVVAMNEMVDSGHTAARLSTRCDNYRAQSLYFALGYRGVDTSVLMLKAPQTKKAAP